MSDDTTQDALLDDAAGVALGATSSPDAERVRALAASDAGFASELAAMEAVVAEMALLLPQQAMNRGRSAGVRSRLLSKAAASRGYVRPQARPPVELVKPAVYATGATPRATAPSGGQGGAAHGASTLVQPARVIAARTTHGMSWLAIAATIAFVASTAQLWRVARERDTLRAALSSNEGTYGSRVAVLDSLVASRDSVIATLTGPNMKVVNLVNHRSQDPLARMFWDQKQQQWTMYAYHLAAPRPGRTYQVWLITSTAPAPISAGTFSPDANGTAVLHARYALAPHALERVAVTEEPAGGVSAPTGRVIIAGAGQ